MPFIYATESDLRNYIDERSLVQLTSDDIETDPDDVSKINGTVLMACENAAAQTISNHLRDNYSVDLTGASLTQDIVQIAAQLTLANLLERRRSYVESEKIRELYISRLIDFVKREHEKIEATPSVGKKSAER